MLIAKKIQPTDGPTTTLLIWGIPSEVKDQFKKTVRESGGTMRDAVISFMETYGRPNPC